MEITGTAGQQPRLTAASGLWEKPVPTTGTITPMIHEQQETSPFSLATTRIRSIRDVPVSDEGRNSSPGVTLA